jgi:hypothetical protein
MAAMILWWSPVNGLFILFAIFICMIYMIVEALMKINNGLWSSFVTYLFSQQQKTDQLKHPFEY